MSFKRNLKMNFSRWSSDIRKKDKDMSKKGSVTIYTTKGNNTVHAN